MAPFSSNGQSYESLQTGKMSKHYDAGSIGSNTFREQRRKAYEGCETDEQLFNTHNNIQSIFDNRHHDATYDDDLNSAGSSLGGYSNLGPGGGDAGSKAGNSVRTREELRLSLIARRRRLAQMENAMEGDASIDFSLKLNNRGRNTDASSLVSSLRDSIISLNDSFSLHDSLLSRKPKKQKKASKDKKSKKSKKKTLSKDKDRKKRKEKEKEREKKKSSKRKHKEKHSSKSKKKHKKKAKYQDSSSESSSDSDSDDNSQEYNHSKQPSQKREEHQPKQLRSSRAQNGQHGSGRKQQQQQQHRHSESSSGDKEHRNKGLMSPKGMKPMKSNVVQYACDESTGMCAYHPDIQLRKKSRFGGWKDVLRSCPKCIAEANNGNGKQSNGRKKGSMDNSNRSGVRGERNKGPLDRRRKIDPESSDSSSDSHSKKKMQHQQQLQQQQRSSSSRRTDPRRDNSGRRPGDPPRGASQPPRTRMSRQSTQRSGSQQPQQQRGASVSSRAPSMKASGSGSRRPRPNGKEIQQQQQQQPPSSSRRPSHKDPPSRKMNGKDSSTSVRSQSVSTQRKTGRASSSKPSSSRSTNHPSAGSTKDPNNNHHRMRPQQLSSSQPTGKRSGRERMVAEQQQQHLSTRSAGIMNAVDFDPPLKVDSFDQDHQDNNNYGNHQKMKSKTFHGTSAASTAHSPGQQQQRSTSFNVEGIISSEALRNFVMAESAHFDKSAHNFDASPENMADLERALREQVARLSIGSDDGEIDLLEGGDISSNSKFSVLRDVVRSYMMNGDNNNNGGGTGSASVGMNNNHHGRSGEYARQKTDNINSPKREQQQPSTSYKLGEEGRRRDMIKDDDKDVALMRIASLQPNEPAFIRRTTGKWTFSKVKNVASDSIVFIVNENGSSKAYNVKYWVSHIRTLKAPAAATAQPQHTNSHSPDGGGDGGGRNHDTGGRRGMFAKQSSQTRFSIKNLRPPTPSDSEDDEY